MQEKYVHFQGNFPKSWCQTAFYGCKVLKIETNEFKSSGKRMSIEIEAPHLKKKYYLYCFNDNGLVDIVAQSGLRTGDFLSCFAEITYYKNKDGKYCEAYKIRPNVSYSDGTSESEYHFQFMRIVRENTPEKKAAPGRYTKEEILNKMLGVA